MKQKPIQTIYAEFNDDPTTWQNYVAPELDAALVKELEAIATLPNGQPRFRVRWGCDCYIDVEDQLEINENGLVVGVEKGGRFHQDALVIFDKANGYTYKDEKGFLKFVKTGEKDTAPAGVILDPVIETVSIGCPRFRVEEFLDRQTSEIFGDGDYFTIWTVEEKKFIRETETEIQIESVYNPFSRYDVEQAKNLYNERLNETPDKIRAAFIKDQEARAARKIARAEQQKAENEAMVDQFFTDKSYKQIEGVKSYASH